MTPGGPAVAALGGGHGLSTTLRAARLYAGAITAVVSVADDGGSSGRLRQIAGIPAPGDLRRCLVALAADEGSLWARAFEYRFGAGTGELEGHALGNLLIAGLAGVAGTFAGALAEAARMVGAVGRVVPASEEPVVLKAEVAGREVVGQMAVSEAPGPITCLSMDPADPDVPADAVAAIARADQVVLGPGSLYTSVLAAAAVPGVRAAINARPGGRVYVCNLRPQPPETAGFDERAHLRAVLDHGIAVDVMVAGGEGPDRVLGVPVARADLARPGGDGHEPARLAAVLQALT